jgi:hypothetical protein
MRRIVLFLTAAVLTLGGFANVTGPAGAQTTSAAAACAGRIEANGAEGKAANLAAMNKVLGVAPADLVPALTALRDAFQKKGEKLFDSEQGIALLAGVDTWMYENCPGTKVPVTAIDYEFDGVPAALPAGNVQIQLTNDAPKEMHEMALFKLTEKGAAMDPEKFLALPQGKAQKLVDLSSSTFMFAAPGQRGYGIATLTPGQYVYACFLPVGGKKNGKPHFTQGMYGTLTVQ